MRFIEVTDLHGDKMLINPARITRVYVSIEGATRIEHDPFHPEYGEMNYTDVKEKLDAVAQLLNDAAIIEAATFSR